MKKNIIILVCLALFLQTNLFAQISSTHQSMVKVAKERVHPRTSKIAMVNNNTSISYMYGIDDVNIGYHKFFLIQDGVSTIYEIKIDNNDNIDQITDIKVLDNTLYFCGSLENSKSYTSGFVARADINVFFASGYYEILPINQTILIDRIEPYVDHNVTYVACLPSTKDYIYNINFNSNTYNYASLNIDENCMESYADMILYKNYIVLLSIFRVINNPSNYGYFLRLYKKGDLQAPSNNNKIEIPTYLYNIYPYHPLLAKSEINEDIYIATAPIIQEEDNRSSLLDINRIHITANEPISRENYQITTSDLSFNLLWSIKSTEINRQRELYLLTTRADRESRVFYCNFSDNTQPVKIFEYNNLDDFYTALEIYNNDYFICVGGERNEGFHNFTTWDKHSTYNEYECERRINKNYTEQGLGYSTRSDYLWLFPNNEQLLNKIAIPKRLEYIIKCEIKQ